MPTVRIAVPLPAPLSHPHGVPRLEAVVLRPVREAPVRQPLPPCLRELLDDGIIG